jgi:glycosyltransferase involved in cell wall biosynthesis
MAATLAYGGATHIALPLASKNPLRIWLNSFALERIIRSHKVDIIHARSRAPAWSAWLAAKRTGCKLVTTFHGAYSVENEWKRRYNEVMARGDRVIAISHFIAGYIHQYYAVDENKLRIIHRGVDTGQFNPAKIMPGRLIELSKQWRLPENLPLILFAGRIMRWKGQHVFIEALAALPHRNFFAIILGDDKGHETYRAELEALIVARGLEGHVRIAHHTPYISEAYMLARVVVATSVDPEPFGRVVLEAQAMGKPVIATSQGGPMETVVPNETGWLVAPGDAEALSRRIDHVLGLDEETLRKISAGAVANAQHFTMEKMCRETVEVYKELLD